ncbi:MAG TPA: sulfatase-like hydrolase/transferase [Rhizomicrobium sp.]|nr:sulfatase-like hydrolase/transferase [Rhizomicrobium sp.]
MFDRRTLLKLAGSAAAVASTSPASSAHRARLRCTTTQPNFIHICADDVRNSDVKVMPNLRAYLRDPGILFGKHMTPFTLCAPSRAGILTGLEPHNHGILKDKGSGGYNGYQHLEDNALPVWLTAAGYYVGHIGKFINQYDKIAPDHIPPGYADWRAMSCDFSKYKNFTLNENGTQVSYDQGQYTTDVFVQKALDFIASAPQPFALFFWPNACHWPAIPDDADVGTFDHVDMPIYPNFNEADVSDKPRFIRKLPLLSRKKIAKVKHRWRTRSECLQSLDRGIATLVTALRTSGLLANTHVMYTSDNGFIDGEHRVSRGKDLLYEEAAGVPLFWRQPSGYADECHQVVSNIDVTATMVDLSGATAGRILDGTSMTPLLGNVTAPWKSATLLQSSRCVGIATDNYRYILWNRTQEVELYDMSIDKFQLDNKAGVAEYQEIQQACAAALQSLTGCAGDTCAWTGNFPPPPKEG